MSRRARLTRRLFCGVAGAVTAFTGSPAIAQATPRPDIVLFIADDMSREDVAAYGSPDARTPNIDRLAQDGMRFTNAFAASPTCTPSRSSIFTGDFPMRNGAHANHTPINDGITTMPAYLEKLGYRVVIAGKTDFGERSNFPFEYFPGSVIHPPGKTNVLWSKLDTDAIDHLLVTRDRGKPIALVVASFASHVFWPDNEGYDASKLAVPRYLLDTPSLRTVRTRYLTKVTLADTELGAVRASITKYGTPGNTLFLFTADQGAQFPFAKWTLYDAGLATPLIAAWPGHVAAGKVSGAMVSLVDLLPTIEHAAGGPPITDIDGRDFLPVMEGKATTLRSEIYAAHSGDPKVGPNQNRAPSRAIRTDRYKLIVNLAPELTLVNAISQESLRPDNTYWTDWVQRAATDPRAAAIVERFHHRPAIELYDIQADPSELHNLAGDPKYAATIKTLHARLDAWRLQQGEKLDHIVMPEDSNPGHFPYAQ